MDRPLGPKSVFITGATGCSGGALTARLASRGSRVVALVRDERRASHLAGLPGVTLVAGDLAARDRISAAMRGSEVVYHLAAKVHAPPGEPEGEFTRVNLDGTRHVIEAAVENQVNSFVFFSTVAVYPESDRPLDESDTPAPTTSYGASKLAAERLVLSRAAAGGVRAAVLRLPAVYGTRDRGNIGKLVRSITRGRFFLIGDSANVKSLVAVENVVDAALLVAGDERARGQVYIVCDERGYTLAEIVEAVNTVLGLRRRTPRLPYGPAVWLGRGADVLSALTGLNLPISESRVYKLTATTLYSAAKIQRELGFTPRVSLREGLVKIIGEIKAGGPELGSGRGFKG